MIFLKGKASILVDFHPLFAKKLFLASIISMNMPYEMLAFYRFTPIKNPRNVIKEFKDFFESLKMGPAKGRVYISEEGINGQMSVHAEDLSAAKRYLSSIIGLCDMPIKTQSYSTHGFEKLIIKYRKYLVGIKAPVNLTLKGEYLSPKEWKKTLEDENDILIVDGRNDYEWEVGHFKGAEKPPCKTFRDFPGYIQKIKKEHGTDKKVLMSCTGGIRCELLSSMMKEEGFDNVYQLEGGVINYGNTMGSDQWKGRLFVFDDRMATPLKKGENPEPISACHTCDTLSDTHYNCANMDCNKLFLACPSCIEKRQGCCSEGCRSAPRLRKFNAKAGNLPFRKWYKYFEDKSA